ncbi:disintegrin [Achlya hypogyna]|uniref:Disintegrin n=1 Tax=Achlya hypogyna TaxID=1202772 RepID=A0A1V9YAI2_ACHHY|nr:disintegrin [Achlya hypogyna]
MKLLWLCVVANAVGVALGMDLLDAAAKQCTCANDCPQLTCYENSCSPTGYCLYKQKPTGSKCPGQSCTNGGVCDDDNNDTCNEKAECISAFKPSTTMCRPSAGQCDVAEYCTGTGGSCPADKYAPDTTECTGTCNGGACDGLDKCDGFGHCIDVYLPSTTVCRKSVGECDVAETCTGTSGQCPVDTFAAATVKCTGKSNGGACDSQDYCDGKGNCVDVYLPSTTVCRAVVWDLPHRCVRLVVDDVYWHL